MPQPGLAAQVGLIRRPPTQALMWSPAVVEVQMLSNRCKGFRHVGVGFQIDLLVFDTLPDPLDKDVVPPGSLSIHADLDAVGDQKACEGRTGELAALIGIEDLRLAIAGDGLIDSLDVEVGIHSDG